MILIQRFRCSETCSNERIKYARDRWLGASLKNMHPAAHETLLTILDVHNARILNPMNLGFLIGTLGNEDLSNQTPLQLG